MAIYTVRLAAGAAPASGLTVYTTPADGATYVIRSVLIGSVVTGSSFEVDMRINGVILIGNLISTGANSVLNVWNQRTVLLAGDTIKIGYSGGAPSYSITGYRLS
jgi:hypothetical protein